MVDGRMVLSHCGLAITSRFNRCALIPLIGRGDWGKGELYRQGRGAWRAPGAVATRVPVVALAIREARACLNKAPFGPQHHLFINEMS
jgi:hypothetical protein